MPRRFEPLHIARLGMLALTPLLAATGAGPAGAKSRVASSHHHRTIRPHRHVVRVSPAPARVATPPAAAVPADCADVDLQPSAANVDRVRVATFCLINDQRARHGIARLRQNAALESAAQGHSNDMVARDYFAHVAPTGSDLVERVLASGYATPRLAFRVGENIAYGTDQVATPGATVAAWMNSPEHRANILNPAFTETGVGVAPEAPPSRSAGQSGATYTQCFGAVG